MAIAEERRSAQNRQRVTGVSKIVLGILLRSVTHATFSPNRMSRPSSSRTLKPPSTPVKSRVSPGSTQVRARTQSGVRSVTPVRSKAPEVVVPPSPSVPLSIKEVIALKRAEAKKGQLKAGDGPLDNLASAEDALPDAPSKQEEDDILGRLSVRETIERARSTGENRPITFASC